MDRIRKKKTVITIIVVLILIGLISIKVTTNSKYKQVMKIGAILPLSGDAAEYGLSCQRGLEMAIEDSVHKYRRYGRIKWEIVYEDSRSDPEKAVSAINKLISVDRVNLVIGGMFPATARAIAPIAQNNGVVLISPTCADPAVPRIGEYIFSIFPSEQFEGEYLGSEVSKLWPDISRVAVVYSETDAKIACKDAFRNAVSKMGIEITCEEGVAPGTSDLDAVVARIASGDPQVVFFALDLPETALALKAATKQGMTAKFMGTSVCYDQKLFDLAGADAAGIVISAPFFHVDRGGVSPFVREYKKKYSLIPDTWAAFGYDAISIASSAIWNYQGESESFCRQLFTEFAFRGATGKMKVNPDGSVKRRMHLLTTHLLSRSFVLMDIPHIRR